MDFLQLLKLTGFVKVTPSADLKPKEPLIKKDLDGSIIENPQAQKYERPWQQ